MSRSEAELWRLRNEVLPELRANVRAREGSDAADQAYTYDLLAQIAAAEARVDKLVHRSAEPAPQLEVRAGVAGPGKAVTLDFGDGAEEFGFVAELPVSGQISPESPVGRAIAGCVAGDTVTVRLPNGADVDVAVLAVAD